MEQFFSILFIAGFVAVPVYLFRRDQNKLRMYHQRGIASLWAFVGEKDDVVFYRDCGGLWIETSKSDIEKGIRATCKTQVSTYCILLHEAKLCFNYDSEKNAVQVVLGKEEYEFTQNNYYEEWAKGNKEFNDRVNKAMGRS